MVTFSVRFSGNKIRPILCVGACCMVSGGAKFCSSSIQTMLSVVFISSERDTTLSAGGIVGVPRSWGPVRCVRLDQATVIEIRRLDVPLRLGIEKRH